MKSPDSTARSCSGSRCRSGWRRCADGPMSGPRPEGRRMPLAKSRMSWTPSDERVGEGIPIEVDVVPVRDTNLQATTATLIGGFEPCIELAELAAVGGTLGTQAILGKIPLPECRVD